MLGSIIVELYYAHLLDNSYIFHADFRAKIVKCNIFWGSQIIHISLEL